MIPSSPHSDPEFWHGLTMWTDLLSAQVQQYADGNQLALHIRGREDLAADVNLSASDARRLRDLLNVATASGVL